MSDTLDVLAIAKTVATSRFPVEQASIGGVDRASGRWVRVVPFRFGERDSDPQVRNVGYVEAKEGWKLRWPFVRPHLRESLELLTELSRGGVATVGFVRPAPGAMIAIDSMTLRMRCLSENCREEHSLPILD